MCINKKPISSSILRHYVQQLNTGKKNFDVSELTSFLETSSTDSRRAALMNAQTHTYEDLPPMEQHRKVPFFIRGKIFEMLVTNQFDDFFNRVITFDNLRTKKAKASVQSRIDEIGPTALLISNSNLEKLRLLVKRIHNRDIPPQIIELIGNKYSKVGDLFNADEMEYSYKFHANVRLGERIYQIAGECDGLLPIVTKDGRNAHLILEIKTSSKMYYSNHMKKIIKSMSYDFQVMFYTFAMQVLKMNPLTHSLFLMANPSNDVFNLDAFDTLNPETHETFKKIMRSLYEL